LLRVIRHILRVYSYIFLAVHGLAALLLSAVIVASPYENVQLGWLPWQGEALGAALAVFGLVALILVLLAVLGRARILLMLFALAALVLVVRGFFFSPWRFSGIHAAQDAFHYVLGMLLAFIGAIPVGPPKERRYLR
jgi:hypothetical protein